jgi:5-methyltetrahydrofolate--homocysteine methyltransferase
MLRTSFPPALAVRASAAAGSLVFPARGGPALLLDAAMGTALIARGLDSAHEPAVAWTVRRPEEIRAVHTAHVRAGAMLVLTCTFGARAPTRDELLAALRLASGAGPRWVVLSLWAGLEPRLIDCAVQTAQRAPRPPDAVWLETATSADQAERALAAALEAGQGPGESTESPLPVVVTLAGTVLRQPGFAAALGRLGRGGAAAAGLNCSPWPSQAGGLAALAREAVDALGDCPLVLKPDAGISSPWAWADELALAVSAGARLVGGCCGTAALHLEALAGRLLPAEGR